jgi:hypothetical protein
MAVNFGATGDGGKLSAPLAGWAIFADWWCAAIA